MGNKHNFFFKILFLAFGNVVGQNFNLTICKNHFYKAAELIRFINKRHINLYLVAFVFKVN